MLYSKFLAIEAIIRSAEIIYVGSILLNAMHFDLLRFIIAAILEYL